MSESVDELHDRVAAVVARRWSGAQLLELGATSGHSGLTLYAKLAGASCPARVIVKLCPPGREPRGRHDVARQARLLEELAPFDGVPVPEVFLINTEPPPTVLLSWVAGEAAEPVLELEPGERPVPLLEARAFAAATTLAALHAVPVATLSATRDERVWSPLEELERWLPTMATVEEELRTGDQLLERALAEAVPEAIGPCIVHGDFRLGNLICEGEDVRAIIDWEIWSIGDPRMDLGWFGIMSDPDALPGITTSTEGLVPVEALHAKYEEHSGRQLVDQHWFDAMARYKMAAIMGNNLKRHRTGRRDDPYQERLVLTIPALIESGLRLLGR